MGLALWGHRAPQPCLAHPCCVWQRWCRRRQPELTTERKPGVTGSEPETQRPLGERGQSMPN